MGRGRFRWGRRGNLWPPGNVLAGLGIILRAGRTRAKAGQQDEATGEAKRRGIGHDSPPQANLIMILNIKFCRKGKRNIA